MIARKAVAGDFGLRWSERLTFDHQTMTIAGCKCARCWDWKTEPQNREFWRLK